MYYKKILSLISNYIISNNWNSLKIHDLEKKLKIYKMIIYLEIYNNYFFNINLNNTNNFKKVNKTWFLKFNIYKLYFNSKMSYKKFLKIFWKNFKKTYI